MDFLQSNSFHKASNCIWISLTVAVFQELYYAPYNDQKLWILWVEPGESKGDASLRPLDIKANALQTEHSVQRLFLVRPMPLESENYVFVVKITEF